MMYNAATIEMPSILFGSPGDWWKYFQKRFYQSFEEYLQSACDPDALYKYIRSLYAKQGLCV